MWSVFNEAVCKADPSATHDAIRKKIIEILGHSNRLLEKINIGGMRAPHIKNRSTMAQLTERKRKLVESTEGDLKDERTTETVETLAPGPSKEPKTTAEANTVTEAGPSPKPDTSNVIVTSEKQ